MQKSVGLKEETSAGCKTVKWYAEQIMKLDEQLTEKESILHRKCAEISHAENILEMVGEDFSRDFGRNGRHQ